MKHLTTLLFFLSAFAFGYAQNEPTILNEVEYREMKASGLLNLETHTLISPDSNVTEHVLIQPSVAGERDGFCNCWIEPDETYTEAYFAENGIDDGSTDNIVFPFDFNLFGETYNNFWINTNGNVTFDGGNGTYTASGFPANVVMLAPFWADVDFGCDDCGTLFYKVTEDAVYINWVEVGYYNSQADKTNSFQVIFTTNDSNVLQNENTVQFCYLDMQWTTGSASGGTNGFGGAPANVGINAGNDEDYISIGRFGEDSYVFDGPFGYTDGVNALDNQEVNFNPTLNSLDNPAPVVFGNNSCDTTLVCENTVITEQITFISTDEESTTVVSVDDGGLSTLDFTVEESADVSTVSLVYDSNVTDGVYEVVVTGANPNDLNNSTAISIYVTVDNSIENPVLTLEIDGLMVENATYCPGEAGVLIEASEGFDSYLWNNGSTDSSPTFTAGEYSLTATFGACESIIGPVHIAQTPFTSPEVLVNQNFICEDETTFISFPDAEDFDSVLWQVSGLEGEIISDDHTLSYVDVVSGVYSLTASLIGECGQTSYVSIQNDIIQTPDLNEEIIFDDNQFFWSGAYSDLNTCGLNLQMFDSESDTWEGASVNVFVDGVGPNTYSITNGFSQVLAGVDAYHGQLIEYYFIPGFDDEDVDLTIWNSDNEVIFNTQDGDVAFSGIDPFFTQTAGCGFNALEGNWNVQVISGSEDYTFAFPSVFNPVAGANSFTIPEGESGEYLLTFTTANCNTEIEFSLSFITLSDGQVFGANNSSSILINLGQNDSTVQPFTSNFNNGNSTLYIITDENNNIISSSGNVIDFAGFDIGNYSVYALSYSVLPEIIIGANIFLMDLSDGGLLSTNHVDVSIIDSAENLAEIDAHAPVFTYNLENITVTNLSSHQTITLMDTSGQLVYQEETHDDTWNLDISNISAGAYILTVTAENGNSYSFKMAK